MSTYASWTGCVPQRPFEPSPQFLVWVQQVIDAREYPAGNPITAFSLGRPSRLKKKRKKKPGAHVPMVGRKKKTPVAQF